jgi:hypothetical protein
VALYRHGEADAAVEMVLRHARLAADGGFDGLTIAEHHAGFPGYFPSPLQVSEWILSDTSIPWAGACPILLTLRPVPLTLEELAWLAARHPDRVAAGLAAGYDSRDFAVYGLNYGHRLKSYFAKLDEWGQCVAGTSGDLLRRDSAIAKYIADIPTVVASGSPTAIRLAGQHGLGIILPPLDADNRASRLAAYADHGGAGPRVLSRWVWLGPFREGGTGPLDRLLSEYTGGKPGAAPVYLPEYCVADSGPELADMLLEEMFAAKATCISLRFYFPGLSGEEVAEQIGLFGREVLPPLRAGVATALATSPN